MPLWPDGAFYPSNLGVKHLQYCAASPSVLPQSSYITGPGRSRVRLLTGHRVSTGEGLTAPLASVPQMPGVPQAPPVTTKADPIPGKCPLGADLVTFPSTGHHTGPHVGRH